MPDNGTPLSLLGYHLTFDAEMSSPADMAKFSNVYSNGDHTLWMNHEAEWYGEYSASNPNNPFSFGNGALAITASPVTSGANLPYTSGLLQTAGKFSQNQGYFEMRAQVPNNPGFWSAFWQLPNGGYYPEVDILEQPNNSGTNSQYWTHTDSPTDNSSGFYDTGVNLSGGFHTYGFMWTGNFIQYVFDGKYIGTQHDTPPMLAATQMYLLANLAVGGPGSWPGTPSSGDKATLQIDYIRAFSADPTVAAVAQQPISSPDHVDTTPVLLPAAVFDPAPIGTGPDSLTLKIAESVLPGADAQFTVSVDGVQQGGVATVQANDAFGQTQTFTFKGNFGAGVHNVAINFLNDAYVQGYGDRNLLVKSAGFDGTAITGLPLSLYNTGSQAFSFAAKSVTSPPTGGATPTTPPVGAPALFDAAYYLAQNPDVAAAGVDPSQHYATMGWKEGRNPSAGFDVRDYLAANPDVKAAGIDPLQHYQNFGRAEGRSAFAVSAVAKDPLLDATYYYAHNPDVRAAGVDANAHYLANGFKEGRNPDAYFDTNYYLTQNPDVKAAGVDPLWHYETFGQAEGRQASLVFDGAKYLAANPDVKAAGFNPLAHYLSYGQAEGRQTFLTGGTAAADPLVDAAYYDAQLGATLIPTGLQAQQQAAYSYDATGWQKGLNPDAFFDTAYYLSHNPDVAAAHIDPLVQFEQVGWKQGRDPSAQFSVDKYLAAYSDVKSANIDPLQHYLVTGQAQGRTAFAV